MSPYRRQHRPGAPATQGPPRTATLPLLVLLVIALLGLERRCHDAETRHPGEFTQ